MKKLYILIFLLIPIFVKAQITPPIDTIHYLQKSNTIRTDTLATNLLTLNQTNNTAQPMSGATLKSYFQLGLQKQMTAGSGLSISSNVIMNTAPDQTVTLTAGNGIAISGSYPSFTISQIAPTIATPTRTVNTSFTPSSTKTAYFYYSVLCSVTNPLLAGASTATVTVQYSTNGGSTWNDYAIIGNSSSVGVAVAIALTNGQTGELSGIVPANYLLQIKSVTAGTATVTVQKSIEVTY